jgi:hypothetical protein
VKESLGPCFESQFLRTEADQERETFRARGPRGSSKYNSLFVQQESTGLNVGHGYMKGGKRPNSEWDANATMEKVSVFRLHFSKDAILNGKS